MDGVKIPNTIIFYYALKTAGALVDNSVMIGDDLNTDISGAIKVNMKAIYYNPHQKVHDFNIWKEVQNLNEINVSNIMTKKPINIDKQSLAAKALALIN